MTKIDSLKAAANSIRALSADAIQAANSGHPGMPLGCAELAAALYGEIMKHNPRDSSWIDRDRFVLSAGHGSMLLYSILHLSGYDVSMDDIKSFRQAGSRCPGHPEYGITDGVEATTGPLGQGIAMAVGMAIAETRLAARFNTEDHTIVDHYTYALIGEGCLMEGVSAEASSLAGRFKLGKLIVFYDQNNMTIDGAASLTFSEDAAARYRAYGWQVLSGSMYDIEGIISLARQAKADERPSLIILESIIGKSAPNENTASVHGAPLGPEGVAAVKRNLGLPEDKEFYAAPEVYEYFAARREVFAEYQRRWESDFAQWSLRNPDKRREWDSFFSLETEAPADFPAYAVGETLATRKASGAALRIIAASRANLTGGSADLEGPNDVGAPCLGVYDAQNRAGGIIRFGIREFAMSAISCGIALHGGLRPFCATFAVFSDYLRPSIRLAALMRLPVIYIFTHDSIFVGEDGPTHQPVEIMAALRAIPNLQVIRPGDAQETNCAWKMAMEAKDHPVCLMLTRQSVPVYKKDDPDWQNTIRCGAYIARYGAIEPDVTILASGSEVSLALEAVSEAPEKTIRVVSVCDRELFTAQPSVIREKIIGAAKRVVVAEAGSPMGWEGFVSVPEDVFCVRGFGVSAPAKDAGAALGFTANKLAELLKRG